MTKSGTPSGPGALPDGILLAQSMIYSFVIFGKSKKGPVEGLVLFLYASWNSPSMLSNLPGSVILGMGLLPTSFLETILYGNPHGSVSTCWHSLSQHVFIDLNISRFSFDLASLYVCRFSAWCVGLFLWWFLFIFLLAACHSFFNSAIVSDHQ